MQKEDLVIAASSGAHFQIYLFGSPPTVRWRLLSGNNRDMCHGAEHFDDTVECIDNITLFVQRLSSLQPLIKRDDKGGWTWALLDRGVVVSVAGHSYDRQVRCARALAKVLADAPTAPIRPQQAVPDHRRWVTSSRSGANSRLDRPARGPAR